MPAAKPPTGRWKNRNISWRHSSGGPTGGPASFGSLHGCRWIRLRPHASGAGPAVIAGTAGCHAPEASASGEASFTGPPTASGRDSPLSTRQERPSPVARFRAGPGASSISRRADYSEAGASPAGTSRGTITASVSSPAGASAPWRGSTPAATVGSTEGAY